MTSATPKPRAGEHTKGPWRVHTSGSIYAGPSYVATTVGEVDQADLNARRIVACLNACEGMPTDMLEAGNYAHDLDVSAGAIAERDLLRERERELVAAIEAALAYCESEAIGTVQQEIADNERMRQTLRNALEYGR